MAEPSNAAGTVGKALEVLDLVAAQERPVRFGDLQGLSRFPKATLYRLLQTLTQEGMLAYDTDRQTYSMGIRLVRLAHAAWQQSSLAPIARRHIESLSARVGETVHLAQLDNAQVLYVDKVNARDPLPMYSQAGKVGPAYCTGVGKVMLAYLDGAVLARTIAQQSFHAFTSQTLDSEDLLRSEITAIQARGYGFDREEHEPGIICVALPILTDHGRALGALSVTSSTQRTNLQALESLVPLVQATAAAISEEAKTWHFPDTSPLTPQTPNRSDALCPASP